MTRILKQLSAARLVIESRESLDHLDDLDHQVIAAMHARARRPSTWSTSTFVLRGAAALGLRCLGSRCQWRLAEPGEPDRRDRSQTGTLKRGTRPLVVRRGPGPLPALLRPAISIVDPGVLSSSRLRFRAPACSAFSDFDVQLGARAVGANAHPRIWGGRTRWPGTGFVVQNWTVLQGHWSRQGSTAVGLRPALTTQASPGHSSGPIHRRKPATWRPRCPS